MIDFKNKQADLQRPFRDTSTDFPPRIGNFIFVKKFFPNKKIRHFYFAIYEDKAGRRAIAKQWNKSCKYIDYYWLVNEINVYREAHRLLGDNHQIKQKYPNIHIPDLFDVVREKDKLIMLIEEIDGQTLKTLPLEKQIAICQDVIDYMASLGDKIDSSAKNVLVKRSMWYVLAIFPFIFTVAVINYPKKFLNFLRGAIIFAHNILRVIMRKEMTLVHRDLQSDHIIVKDGNVWLIDFQLSVIANPAFETVGMVSGSWNNVNFSDNFENGCVMGVIKKDKNKFYAYKTLSIYTAFYNLGAVKVMTSDKALSYLDYSLRLKYLDKN